MEEQARAQIEDSVAGRIHRHPAILKCRHSQASADNVFNATMPKLSCSVEPLVFEAVSVPAKLPIHRYQINC